jgi:hypothetical protein
MSIEETRPHWAILTAALSSLLLLSTTVAFATEKAGPNDSTEVAECLELEQNPMDGGIEYHFANHCKQHLTCRVEWTLSCGEKAPFRQYRRQSSVSLAPSIDQSVTANVRDCKGESWEIFGVSWSCSPT